MTVYDKPFIYTLSHVLTGTVAVFYPFVAVHFIVYQLLQLVLNVRFFGLSLTYEEGNHWRHTLAKFAEFLVGVLLGLIGLYLRQHNAI